MLIEKSIHPFYTGKGRTFYNAECVCVSYHKAREVGSGEALQGEGIHELRGSRGWGWKELGGTGSCWQELGEAGRGWG